ncbi:hypothetical protein C8R44DRAFT_724406 [Mycena epipterygia]|nr:hypothetical protein C8R44DRAFT_724406 [Mycena epipterygia]
MEAEKTSLNLTSSEAILASAMNIILSPKTHHLPRKIRSVENISPKKDAQMPLKTRPKPKPMYNNENSANGVLIEPVNSKTVEEGSLRKAPVDVTLKRKSPDTGKDEEERSLKKARVPTDTRPKSANDESESSQRHKKLPKKEIITLDNFPAPPTVTYIIFIVQSLTNPHVWPKSKSKAKTVKTRKPKKQELKVPKPAAKKSAARKKTTIDSEKPIESHKYGTRSHKAAAPLDINLFFQYGLMKRGVLPSAEARLGLRDNIDAPCGPSHTGKMVQKGDRHPWLKHNLCPALVVTPFEPRMHGGFPRVDTEKGRGSRLTSLLAVSYVHAPLPVPIATIITPYKHEPQRKAPGLGPNPSRRRTDVYCNCPRPRPRHGACRLRPDDPEFRTRVYTAGYVLLRLSRPHPFPPLTCATAVVPSVVVLNPAPRALIHLKLMSSGFGIPYLFGLSLSIDDVAFINLVF